MKCNTCNRTMVMNEEITEAYCGVCDHTAVVDITSYKGSIVEEDELLGHDLEGIEDRAALNLREIHETTRRLRTQMLLNREQFDRDVLRNEYRVRPVFESVDDSDDDEQVVF